MATKIVEKMRGVKEGLEDRVDEFLDRPRYTNAEKRRVAEQLEKHGFSIEDQIKSGYYEEPLGEKLARKWKEFKESREEPIPWWERRTLDDLKDLERTTKELKKKNRQLGGILR
ncbi:MAG: hypothetical protein PHF51_00750 [Candidatus ainarchaeum sp.]|nr:hypothetical protein [Candidatus ainarchaeum sp.]